MAELNSMVRIGTVSAVNSSQKAARVYYQDMENMVSDWLPVLQRPGSSTALPSVNDMVLVLYGYGFNVDGYILGVIG